jgi:rare lipoprotein A
MSKYRLIFLVSFVSLLSFCAPKVYFPPDRVQTGLASWYGPEFHGKKTASGEIFNMYQLTAAHRTLPLGSYVMVTNLRNGKSVRVRINDRGPFVRGRIIDLSYAAAKLIDLIGPGVAPVKVELLDRKEVMVEKEMSIMNGKIIAIQVGAFTEKKNASNLKKTLSRKYKGVYIETFKTHTTKYYRVRIKVENQNKAILLAERLVKDGYSVYLVKND